MISDRGNFALVSYPESWGVSRFKFGQLVKYRDDYAYVSGLNYVCEQTYWVKVEDFEPGWYVEITFITGDMAEFYECCGHHEDCIQEITDRDLGVILASMVVSVPDFVQNQLPGGVIQPGVKGCGSEIQRQQVGITSANTSHPLSVGVL